MTNLLSNSVMFAEKNASFLHLWHRQYETDYRASGWGHNSLGVPTKLAKNNPSLIHIAGYKFVKPNVIQRHLIFKQNFDWSDNYAIHLFVRYYKKKTDEFVIRNLNTTIGSVSRHVLFGNKELCI